MDAILCKLQATFQKIRTKEKYYYQNCCCFSLSLQDIKKIVEETTGSTRSLLCIPSIKSNSYGGRAFSEAAPELWNPIPEYIKRAEILETFKIRLKTFLFQKHYC